MSILDTLKNIFVVTNDPPPLEAKSPAEEEEVFKLEAPVEEEEVFTLVIPADKQEAMNAYVRNLRAWSGEQARANNHAKVLRELFESVAGDVLDEVPEKAVIADGSGLAGAEALTKADVLDMTAHLFGVLEDYDDEDKRKLWKKAAGAVNVKG